eukprot:1158005-Pelagomonas_calceolata.AAC.4
MAHTICKQLGFATEMESVKLWSWLRGAKQTVCSRQTPLGRLAFLLTNPGEKCRCGRSSMVTNAKTRWLDTPLPKACRKVSVEV